jgi:hypothetical protein
MVNEKKLTDKILKYDIPPTQLLSFLESEIFNLKRNSEKILVKSEIIIKQIDIQSGLQILEYNVQNRLGESIAYDIFQDPKFEYTQKLLNYCNENFRT